MSVLHRTVQHVNDLDVPTFIDNLGDFDPSGVNTGEKMDETLQAIAPAADITFKRAVLPAQIEHWHSADEADEDD